MDFISSNAFSTPPKPGLGVGHDRRQPVRRPPSLPPRLGPGDLVGAQQRVVDPADHLRHRVDRVQALVRVGLPGQVGVGGDLPAGQVDGLQPGLDLLHGLVAGQRAERVDVPLALQQRPQPLRARAGPACAPPAPSRAAGPRRPPGRSARCRPSAGRSPTRGCSAAACRSACRAAPWALILVMPLVLPLCVPSRRRSLIVTSCQLCRPRVLPPACGGRPRTALGSTAMNFA